MSHVRDDSDIEQLLRATFTGRAATVHRGPRWRRPRRRSGPPRGRPARWLMPLVAAAAVAAVAVAITLTTAHTQRMPATNHSPTPTRTARTSEPTTDAPRPAVPAMRAVRCTVPLPQTWRHAISAATLRAPRHQLRALAVDDHGDVLADEAPAATAPQTHGLVLVTPQGAVRTLYGTPPPASWNGMRIGSVSVAGRWAAFQVLVGAATGAQSPVQIELVDIATGATRTLRQSGPDDSAIVLGPTIFRGSVYWTDIDAGAARMAGRVYRYDITSAHKTVAATDVVSEPLTSGGGLYWQKADGAVVTSQAGTLAPGFDLAGALLKSSPETTNGHSYVWQDERNLRAVLGWQPGMPRPVAVVPAGRGGQLAGLTGDLLWWSGPGGAWVGDLRTGASTRVAEFGADAPGSPVVAAGNTAALQTSEHALVVLDTSRLPALTC